MYLANPFGKPVWPNHLASPRLPACAFCFSMAAIVLLSHATIMPPRASSSKTTIIAGILAGLLAAGLGAFYLHQQSAPHGTDAPAAGSPAPEPSARAVDALMALPEIKAWSAHIEKASAAARMAP